MLTEFLQTGNGTVIVNGLQPQPISGIKNSVLATVQSLMQLLIPRDANGNLINGCYSGEFLIQAFDTVTGDVFSQIAKLVVSRFGGVTNLLATLSISLSRTGTLAGMTQAPAVLPSGDIDFTFTTGTVNSANVSGLGTIVTV